MWQWRNVDNLRYLDPGTMDSTNSRFTTITRSLYIHLYATETKIISHFGTILSCHLSCIGSVLLRTSEPHLTGARPADNLPLVVGDRHNDVVERRVDVCLTGSLYLYHPLLGCYFLCHILSMIIALLLSSLLLVCNGLLLTLACTGIVFGALPSYRKTSTMTNTTIATNIH